MNIAQDLKIVASSLRCPEVASPEVVRTVCYAIAKYNKLETSEAYSEILLKIPEAIQAWKEGKAHNLSSAVFRRAQFACLNAIRTIRNRERNEQTKETISLDAQKEENANLHETIEGKSETIDWKDAFDFFLINAGFTDREKKVFLGMKDGKSCRAIGEEFGVSGAAINLSQTAIKNKMNRIRVRAFGRND